MSGQNVELALRVLEAFTDRDAERLTALCDPDCEWRPFRAQLEGVAYRGHNGIRQFLNDFEEDWTGLRIDPLRFDERRDRVVVIARAKATGRASGVDVEFDAGFLLELRDGLVMRLTSYDDPAAALEAMGPGP